jgi:hypothetical protein
MKSAICIMSPTFERNLEDQKREKVKSLSLFPLQIAAAIRVCRTFFLNGSSQKFQFVTSFQKGTALRNYRSKLSFGRRTRWSGVLRAFLLYPLWEKPFCPSINYEQ